MHWERCTQGHLLLGTKAMTNLDSILKSRDITLPTKACLVKAVVFPVVLYDVRGALWRKQSAEEVMLLNSGVGEDSWESLDCKEIKPVHPKGNQSWIFIGRTETPILWPHDAKSQFNGKDPDAGKDWQQKEKRSAADVMVREHHWAHRHESEPTPGDSKGQGSLACCSPWCYKELDMTWQMNNNLN